jgi:RNA polymerase sigma-70 factor (ECF subfamily)
VSAEQAFRQYHQAVFRFAYRLTQCEGTAEDITQECFLAFLRAPGRFDGRRGTIKTYLFAIARNLVLKQYRDHRAEVPLGEEDEPPSFEPPDAQELATAVAQAVGALPPLQQEALVLFEYEGFTLEEISQVTGADVGTIKARLHRARAGLKRMLAPYQGTPAPREKTGNAYGTD